MPKAVPIGEFAASMGLKGGITGAAGRGAPVAAGGGVPGAGIAVCAEALGICVTAIAAAPPSIEFFRKSLRDVETLLCFIWNLLLIGTESLELVASENVYGPFFCIARSK
jgi:hypothetical protein